MGSPLYPLTIHLMASCMEKKTGQEAGQTSRRSNFKYHIPLFYMHKCLLRKAGLQNGSPP